MSLNGAGILFKHIEEQITPLYLVESLLSGS